MGSLKSKEFSLAGNRRRNERDWKCEKIWAWEDIALSAFKMEEARWEGPESWSYEQRGTLSQQPATEWVPQAVGNEQQGIGFC